jgi:cell division control protein 45
MTTVKEGPDVQLFTHPGALVRLAGWVGEAIAVLEGEQGRRSGRRANDALVVAALDEGRGVYVVVGLGGGTGWNSSGKKIRSKAEIKEREERKKRKIAERAARKAGEARKKEEQKRLREERNAANGMLDDEEEEEEDSETESEDDSDNSSDEESDEEDESGKRKKNRGLNRFGQAFQEVVEETGARVRIDSFEHSVVEVKKDDVAGFFETLSAKVVVQ